MNCLLAILIIPGTDLAYSSEDGSKCFGTGSQLGIGGGGLMKEVRLPWKVRKLSYQGYGYVALTTEGIVFSRGKNFARRLGIKDMGTFLEWKMCNYDTRIRFVDLELCQNSCYYISDDDRLFASGDKIMRDFCLLAEENYAIAPVMGAIGVKKIPKISGNSPNPVWISEKNVICALCSDEEIIELQSDVIDVFLRANWTFALCRGGQVKFSPDHTDSFMDTDINAPGSKEIYFCGNFVVLIYETGSYRTIRTSAKFEQTGTREIQDVLYENIDKTIVDVFWCDGYLVFLDSDGEIKSFGSDHFYDGRITIPFNQGRGPKSAMSVVS